ncbi:hypothetical protein [Micromonospora sp. NPDC051006]|uniref:hypothetical protein n=1 Tax=Micromonospora sp. NPDC051006 TaxID=3364283 RepID=UPI0037BD200D
MGFDVDVAALRGLPTVFDRLGDDARAGLDYIDTNTALEYGPGFINRISGKHERAVSDVRGFVEDVAKFTASRTGSSLRQSLDYYERTDGAAAEQFDRAFRGGGQVDRSQFASFYRATGSAAGFADRAEPRESFRAIPDYGKDDAFQFEPQLWDIASPTSLTRDALWGATWLAAKLGICDRAYDPYESLIKPIAGDWTGVRGCADVFGNVASALGGMAVNVRWAALGSEQYWQGKAATAFQAHLVNSARKLDEAAVPLVALAAEYRKTAEAMFEIGKVLGSLLSDLVDAAMIFVAAASTAAATSETVVGGVVFGAAAIYEGYKMWDLFKEALDLVGRADSLTSAFTSAVGDFGLAAGADQLPVLAPPPDGLPK